jgi:ABC-type sugar transport system permease subunit
MSLLIFTMLFSGGLIPTYLVVQDLGMLNTRWAMVIPSAIGVWQVIIARTFFRSTIPDELYEAATIDGASAWQRFTKITLPLMKPAILVALLFRTLDAFRVFDTIFIMTAGAQDTESVSILGYNQLISRLNLGLGSAVSVLIFLCVLIIAFLFVRGFGTRLEEGRPGST